MMCNEQNDHEKYDYRFLAYRLDQLEQHINKGLTRLEQETTANNKEVIQLLQTMQEGQNEQNKQLVELQQRQVYFETRLKKIDAINTEVTKNKTQIQNIERRLSIYQAVLIGITISVIASTIMLVIQMI